MLTAHRTSVLVRRTAALTAIMVGMAAAVAYAGQPPRELLAQAMACGNLSAPILYSEYSDTASSVCAAVPDLSEYWEINAAAAAAIADSASVSVGCSASDTYGVYGSRYSQAYSSAQEVIPLTVTQAGRISFPLEVDVDFFYGPDYPYGLSGGPGVSLRCSWHQPDEVFHVGYRTLGHAMWYDLNFDGANYLVTDPHGQTALPAELAPTVVDNMLTIDGTVNVDIDFPAAGDYYLSIALAGYLLVDKDINLDHAEPHSSGVIDAELGFGGFFWDSLDGSTAHLYDTRDPSRSYVPEPTTLSLLLTLGGLIVLRRPSSRT